ncbi:hypothetical protein GCM10010924_05860 [Rhizobium wenxiniae]|uniref:Uncharacterized protein n=1 Tax=Rhizobium wenxiniae TaxID=1737357 RepID=A0A7X0CXQ1_9HYPH|nr:hypothetical protein [Rhizobium wenxiniae]MBB6160435.1 hypothetical protein [Rhizobium wenxiniae]GGF81483.1 hypothetical protein GCM10010924_05860 [Rhizobium wenxiniae]
MFTKPISEKDFITAMTGVEGAPLDISASHFTNGKTVRLFAARYEPAHHAVAPFSRLQLVKSIEHLLDVPETGKVSIYDIAHGRPMYLNDLASSFPSLVVYVARSGKKAFAIIKTADRTSSDAEKFWLGYHGNDKLPSGSTA